MTSLPTSRRVGWNEPVKTDDPYAILRSKAFKPDSSLLLFDFRHACYRAIHTRDLSAEDGTPTSALHGVLDMVQGACSAANTRKFLLVGDGWIDYKRAIFPQYKSRYDRKRDPLEEADHARQQLAIKVAEEGLARLNVPMVHHPKLESDDLIGILANGISYALFEQSHLNGFPAHAPGWLDGLDRVILVTDDKDHYQLLRDNVFVYRGVNKTLMTPAIFLQQFGFPPQEYIDFKALVGEPETGDNIPGVDGFGEKTAMKYVAEHGGLEKCIAYAESQVRSGKKKVYQSDIKLAAQADTARRAYRLSQILTEPDQVKQHGIPVAEIHDCIYRGLSAAFNTSKPITLKAIMEFCGRYSFTTSLDPKRFADLCGYNLRTA